MFSFFIPVKLKAVNTILLTFNTLIITCFILFVSCHRESFPIDEDELPFPAFIQGCDLSFLPEMRAAGLQYKDLQGQPEDPLKTLSKNGMNIVRLRLWHKPDGSYSLQATEALAEELRSIKIPLWACLHYSDTWADPGAQSKPTAWDNCDFEVLKDSIYRYTYRVASLLKPAMMQIGNEINQGLLWPDGHISKPQQMQALLSAGIKACREASPHTKIMLHYAGQEGAYKYFNGLKTLDFDLIGLSYYPIWHGKSLTDLGNTIRKLKSDFNKEVIIAETSYPFSLSWADHTNNIIGSIAQTIPEYPPTAAGQRQYLEALQGAIKVAGGNGWCYWGAEWVAAYGPQSTQGSSWENQALWDFSLKALESQSCFKAKFE